jgi:hypothetical protein
LGISAVEESEVEQVRETALISERAAAEAKKSGRMQIQFISPGWGSSGYYSPEVLEKAAANTVIPAGTHMYADHPTKDERNVRPERSIKDLMAVTVTDAQLGPGGALVGEVQVSRRWRDLVEDLAGHIGVSILGDATDIYEGEAEGRRGRIIEGLAKVHSVDFVTRAGRGGQVLQVLESAHIEIPGLTEGGEDFVHPALEDLLLETIRLEDGMDPTLQEIITSGQGAEGTAKLHAYWRHGEGAAKIRWGVAGDFDRCVRHLGKYIADPKGYCAKMHKDVTGARPGHAPGEGGSKESEASVSGERVLDLLESGLAVDQNGHTYRLEEGSWTPVAPEPRERVITVLESGLGVDEEGHTYRLEESGWAPVVQEAGRVYHWKHGWIPLDHAAAKDIAPAGSTKKAPIPGNKHSEFPKIYSDTTLSSLVAHREKLVSSQAANKRDNPRYKAEIRRLDKAIADRQGNSDDKALDDRISKLEARKAELSKLPSARASRSGVSDQIRDLNRQIAQLHTRKKNNK